MAALRDENLCIIRARKRILQPIELIVDLSACRNFDQNPLIPESVWEFQNEYDSKD